MTIATVPRDRRADLQPDALPLDLIGELGGSPDGADTADADSLGASFDDVRAEHPGLAAPLGACAHPGLHRRAPCRSRRRRALERAEVGADEG